MKLRVKAADRKQQHEQEGIANAELQGEQDQSRYLFRSSLANIFVCICAVTLYVLCFATIYVAYYTDYLLPANRIATGADDAYSSTFSVAHARKHLQELVAFGPRHVGSRLNEVEIPQFLMQKVESLRDGIPAGVHIEADVHRSSGMFYHRFLNGFTNVYTNVTNVVIRLSWGSVDDSAPSVLVNAHYDSFYSSPGASDDGVGVAAMLGILCSVYLHLLIICWCMQSSHFTFLHRDASRTFAWPGPESSSSTALQRRGREQPAGCTRIYYIP